MGLEPDDDFPIHDVDHRRNAPVPVRRLLEPVRDVEELRLGEGGPWSCSPIGRPLRSKPQGIDSAGAPVRFAAIVKMSFRYILHRVVAVGADPERGRGRGRARDQVALLIGAAKIVGDEPPHLLRLEVIGVVVAVRQHVGADEDPPLHLGAEALGARLLVHVGQVGVGGGAVAVPDAVEARQVRRRFRRRDHVVHRDRQPDVRQREVDGRGAELAQLGERGVDRPGDVRVDPGAEILGGQADPDAGQRLGAALACEQARVVLGRAVERRRVARIVARHRVQQQREVVRGAGEGARPGRGSRRRRRARSASTRRRSVSARRRRTAPPAGGSSRRCRCRCPPAPAAPRRRPRCRRSCRRERSRGATGSSPGRNGTSRSTTPSRTRPCWSCRRARCRRAPGARPRARRKATCSSRASARRRSCACPR